jgi:hypothetical protein
MKGYKVDTDTYIEVSKDELENIALESTRTIDIDEFVPKSSIDPRYLIRPYYLVPDGKVGHDAFAVIRETIRAHLFRRESRRYNVLRPGMRNNLLAGLGDCPNDLRKTLRKNPTGHHACANPASDEHMQEPFDTAIGAVASPGERVGIERAGRRCIPHGTDAGGLAVVHAS